jgi:hypothetical protein
MLIFLQNWRARGPYRNLLKKPKERFTRIKKRQETGK